MVVNVIIDLFFFLLGIETSKGPKEPTALIIEFKTVNYLQQLLPFWNVNEINLSYDKLFYNVHVLGVWP